VEEGVLVEVTQTQASFMQDWDIHSVVEARVTVSSVSIEFLEVLISGVSLDIHKECRVVIGAKEINNFLSNEAGFCGSNIRHSIVDLMGRLRGKKTQQ
jgi:hypothetical protein